MKMRRVFFTAIASVLVAASLVACSPKKTNDVSSTDDNTSSVPTSSVEEVKKPSQNPLTGELVTDEAILTYRPVAVMINNIKPALPQRGISEADVIYEMPVEGGVTRLMALFSDYKNLPEIGSIRSARHDYVELVKPLDALYVHIGWSESAKAAIEKEKIKDLNGLTYSNIAFYKDEKRAQTRSSEHCWFTTAKLVAAGIDKIEVPMTVDEPKNLFNFALPDENIMESAANATETLNVGVTFSSGVKSTFTYNSETKKYAKAHYGSAHIDETTGKAVEFSNVFLMYTDVSMMADNYHREVDLSSGHGYYISNGKSILVNFKKSDVNSLIEVFDESGKPLTVNAGNSYFGIIPTGEEKNLSLLTTVE